MKKVLGFLAYAAPVVALAQASIRPGYVNSIITALQGWLNSLIPILIGIAVIVFFWGIIRYVTSGADEEKRKEARNLMVWGIIAIFVMVAVWGLVGLLANFLGIQPGGTVQPPQLPQ